MSGTYGLWSPALGLAGAIAVGTGTLLYFTMWKKAKRCTSTTDLTGKVAIVTGANTGIGFWTAQDFATRNARVILACRNMERGEEAREKIIAATGNKNVVLHHLDLFLFTSVRQFVKQILEEEERLDILVNNAGIYGYPQSPSEHGLDITMATNHFGPFLLTLLLIDLLKKSAPSRIVNVSSIAQYSIAKEIGFDNLHGERQEISIVTYARSKLANLLFTRELARRLEGTGVTAYCVHPGFVATEIGRNMPWFAKLLVRRFYFLMKTAEEGAQTSIFTAVAEEVKDESGKYYMDCASGEHQVNTLANDPEITKKLWDVSCQLTGVSGDI